MRCQSCVITDSPASNSSGFQYQGKNFASCKNSSFPCGFRRFKKGFPLRSRCRSSRILAQESNGAHWEREESRWLREEERWKREEQRWLREEKRWSSDRENWSRESARMKEEITYLRSEVDRLKGQVVEKHEGTMSLRDVLVGLKGLLQTLSTGSTEKVAHSVPPPGQLPVKAPAITAVESVESVKFVLPFEASSEEESASKNLSKTKAPEKSLATATTTAKQESRSLKFGAEGNDVKLLQEALAKLGFYSGDDDMEYASFSSGTDKAVKSWQASIGAPENGFVTAKVLAELISGHQVIAVNTSTAIKPTSSPRESPATVERNSGSRVYLLGEHRWEDPERLLHRRRENVATAQKCFSCKGEGRTLCSECEGTGELNVEEQFLEWAGEGAKCPYCEGSGTVICDECEGKGVGVA